MVHMGYEEPSVFTKYSCHICGKNLKDARGGLRFISRYDKFLCSEECYSKLRQQNKPQKSAAKEDIINLVNKLKKRSQLIQEMQQITATMDAIKSIMYQKNIDVSIYHDHNMWIKMESHARFGLPKVYGWCMSNLKPENGEINPEYAKKYTELMNRRAACDQDFEFITRYLISGKCINYNKKL